MRISVLFILFLISFAGLTQSSKPDNKHCILYLQKRDVPLEKPQAGDWLYHHAEKGQTFEQLERLIKTSSHEITHMLSVKHCIAAVCLMNGSNSLSESDRRPNRLCSSCLHKLQWNLQFNISARLEKLAAYFKKHKLQTDLSFAEADIRAIEE